MHTVGVEVIARNHNHRIEVAEDDNFVSAVSRHVPSRMRAGRGGEIATPPEIAIIIVGVGSPAWSQHGVHPCRWNNLLTAPAAMIEHEATDFCEIARTIARLTAGLDFARRRGHPGYGADTQRVEQTVLNVAVDTFAGRPLYDLANEDAPAVQ